MASALPPNPAGAGPSQERQDSIRASKDLLNFKFSWYEGDWTKDTVDRIAAVAVPDNFESSSDLNVDAAESDGDRGREAVRRQASCLSLVTDIAHDVETAEEWLKRDGNGSRAAIVNVNDSVPEDQDHSASVMTALHLPPPGGDNDVDEIKQAEQALVANSVQDAAEPRSCVEDVDNARSEGQTGPESARTGSERSGFRKKWHGVISKASTIFRS